MRAPTDSLIEGTNRLIVRRQIEYAATLGLPGHFGIRLHARDLEFTYQNSTIGVPASGLSAGSTTTPWCRPIHRTRDDD